MSQGVHSPVVVAEVTRADGSRRKTGLLSGKWEKNKKPGQALSLRRSEPPQCPEALPGLGFGAHASLQDDFIVGHGDSFANT
jgi:hypothetical protein